MAIPTIFEGKLKIPVVVAPMFLVSTPQMVIEACRAGVVGTFPALNRRSTGEFEQWLDEIQTTLSADSIDTPFGVNLIVHRSNPRLQDDLAVCVKKRVPLIITSLGAVAELVDEVHSYGGIVFHDVIKERHARKAAAAGVDGLIAVCAGAGGHAGSYNPLSLVQEIRSFFDGTILLSGTITNGAHIAAAQAMGADLAYMGTRFINTQESAAPDAFKNMIVEGHAADIVYTAAVSGVHANFLRQSLEDNGYDVDALTGMGGKVDLKGISDEASVWKTVWSAGQGVGGIDDDPTTAELCTRLKSEYLEAVDALSLLSRQFDSTQTGITKLKRKLFDMEHDMFRDSVRRFMQAEISPHVDAWREAGRVDPSAFRKAGEQGLLMIWAAEEYGGLGIKDFRYEQILLEENARFGDISFFMTLHSRLVGPYIGELGSEELKQRLLPRCANGETILGVALTESGAGSDRAGMTTRAVSDGDDWVINGSKTYISNGINGGAFVVAAKTVPGQSHAVGLFVVEEGMEGFSRGRNLSKMGLKAQDTAELFFDNVRVPKANVLGDPVKGFYHLMKFLAEERLINAVGNLAHAQVAFDLTLDYIKERMAFGRPIATFQNTRFKMADMRTRLDVTQTFIDRCVLDHNEGQLSSESAAQAKLVTSEVEGWVMDECVQLHGGAGYMDEYRISRMYTDARISRIYAGTSEIMREIIARGLGLREDRVD
jgi:acyl-CoA dehydrogenase